MSGAPSTDRAPPSVAPDTEPAPGLRAAHAQRRPAPRAAGAEPPAGPRGGGAEPGSVPLGTGVDLPDGQRSASAALIELLRAAASPVPVLAQIARSMTRRNLGEAIVRFEAARCSLSSRERLDVACAIVDAAARSMVLADGHGGAVPLADAMREPAAALGTERKTLGRSVGIVPRLPYRGTLAEGVGIREVSAELLARHAMTPAARKCLDWSAGLATLDLRGHRFALMGAGAELAPTEILLRAGASVLFLDLVPAEAWLARFVPTAGTLDFVPGGVDLLAQPREIAATITAWAQGQPVHVGAFGYAAGGNREWRIAAAMNAIVRALPPSIVRSFATYVSPSAPAQACDEDAAHALERLARPTLSERLMRGVRMLRPNLLHVEGTFWPRSVVGLQGASYLAAQYVEKRLSAEAIAARGLGGAGEVPPLVSSQVAGITRSASMAIPAFQASFAGGPALGLESYEPQTTRWLAALIYLEHLLNPDSAARAGRAAGDERRIARAVHACQVHGGLYAYPYAMEGTMVRAAMIGLRHRPELIPKVAMALTGRGGGR